MGRCPFGGQTWLYLNWLRALQRLGHEVWYVEDDTIWPYDPERDSATDDFQYAVRHIANCMCRIGLADQWAVRFVGRKDACWGLTGRQLDQLYASCDALLNVVGATALREEHLAARYRVYVETDPVTVELTLAAGDEKTWNPFASHHVVVTYGENYGAPDCRVPLNGMDGKFLKTRQPIDLTLWPMVYNPDAVDFTTIGNYRQDGMDVAYNGRVYRWSKHYEWEKFMDLPQKTPQPFRVALKVDDPADRQRLIRHGWQLWSPVKMSLDVFDAYPRFFQQSRAEWTVAKDQNVSLRSGWFSERDACYLACGKPVVSQDTGFGNILPTGEGLFAFSTEDQALAAIEQINADYRRHCDAARGIAEEYFDAGKVASRMLSDLGLG